MSPRTENGTPITMLDESQFVTADVLALLSGTDLSLLLDLSSVPLHRVLVGNPRYAKRQADTTLVCERIADDCDSEVDDLLRITDRF
jgi:hypothetical protein